MNKSPCLLSSILKFNFCYKLAVNTGTGIIFRFSSFLCTGTVYRYRYPVPVLLELLVEVAFFHRYTRVPSNGIK